MSRMQSQSKRLRPAVVICAAVVILALLFLVIRLLSPGKDPDNGTPDITVERTALETYVYSYAPNFNEIIDEDPNYAAMQRQITYTEGAETRNFELGQSYSGLRPALEVLLRFFSAVHDGDYAVYASLLSSEFAKTPNNILYPTKEFTPQKIHSISVTYCGTNENGECGFTVEYKIYHNNGTFANYLRENEAKTLYFAVSETGVERKITKIQPYFNATF